MEALPINQQNIFLLRKKNVWYSMCDGNWSNPDTWLSNALDRKNITVPQVGDDVVINHKVTYDLSYNQTINNLFINGTLLCAAGLYQVRLFVNGNVQCSGTFDWSGSVGGGGYTYVVISGTNNFFANFVTGNSTSKITVYYTSPLSFVIPSVNYYNLQIGGNVNNTKSLGTDVTIAGVLTVDSNSKFELSSYNFSCADLIIAGTLSKNSSAGDFTVTNSTGVNLFNTVSFTGSPTVNWSGNMNCDLRGGVNFGTGTFNILTNSNWTFSNGGNNPGSIGSNNFLIASGVTVTLNGSAAWTNNGTVTGVDGTSKLNVATHYCYGNNNAVMATGVFNCNYSGTSTIWASGTTSIPGLSYYNLNIFSGTATLSGNVTVSNNLTVGGTFQLAAYNLTVSGATALSGSILKSGSGTVNFYTLTIGGKIDFSVGTPTVNISGNVSGDCRNGVDFGNNAINVTASITWGTQTGGNVAYPSNWNILIASGKTLTNIGSGTTTGGIQTTGTINGADSTAIFDNRNTCIYNTATAPMVTGKLYCNQAANTFVYGLAGNQDITVPSDAVPGYTNLTLQGSGAKRLLGNVSVKGVYTLTSPATLNSNGFALTNP